MTPLLPLDSTLGLSVWLQGGVAFAVHGVDPSGRWRGSRGVVLDLDDTLYPLRSYVESGFAAVAAHCERAFGIPAHASFAVLSECVARGEQATALQRLCQQFSLNTALVPALVEVYRCHTPSLALSPGATDMLQTLRADGWRLAVLTNGLPRVQALKVEALGLIRLVNHVIYADQVAPGGKPAPAAFAEALRRLGTRPDRTVCVGDDLRCDIVGARAAGLATIRLAADGAAVRGLDADVVVQALRDVPRAAVSLLEGVIRHAA